MTELLHGLNPAQHDAVVNYDVPSLIIAGAGSGKTRVLTSRIAYMLKQGVPPYRIMALTFTNKAAREMRERIAKMVSKEQSDRLWMGTFHSIFLRILRMEADKLGYPSSFTIYDTSDAKNLIKTIVKEMGLNDEFYKPAAILSRISLAKNNLITPEAYMANTSYIVEDRQKKMPEFSEVYTMYARRCRENAAMDFDDMLLNINILFKDFPEVLARYQQRFQYILVDEYQDTNYAQYIIIRRLSQLNNRVCVVGDDAQSIYSFRGAKIENILRFRNDFPDAMTFKLEQNYRSTQTIVNAANSVIEKNVNRLKKESFSDGDKGEKIEVLKAYTDQEEASLVADRMREFARTENAKWSDIALLYRTNMQSRVFEEAFRRRGIPYRIYGGISFYQRKEIKDLMAYLQLIVNPKDDEAFKRIINYPARGIGDVTIGKVAKAAAEKGSSYFEFAMNEDLKTIGLNSGAEKKVKDFVDMINSLSHTRDDMGLYEFGLEVATRSGIISTYKLEQTPEAQSCLDNIEELLNSMQLFTEQESFEYEFDHDTGEEIGEGVVRIPTLIDWLQSVTLLTDMDKEGEQENEKVTLMTVHAAKGLEYDYVFIAGLEENLFPSMMSMDSTEGIEEERRLFYVALTRAKKAAVLSFSETRFKWGSMVFCTPSRFLSEIDPQYLNIAFDLEAKNEITEAKERLVRNYESHNQRTSTQFYKKGNDPYKSRNEYTPKTGNKASSHAADVTAGGRFKSLGVRALRSEETDNLNTLQASTPGNAAAGGEYSAGQRVRHSKFGAGTVESVDDSITGDKKITVVFDDAGKKTLLSKFAKLEIL